jgi:hypothetical protein
MFHTHGTARPGIRVVHRDRLCSGLRDGRRARCKAKRIGCSVRVQPIDVAPSPLRGGRSGPAHSKIPRIAASLVDGKHPMSQTVLKSRVMC